MTSSSAPESKQGVQRERMSNSVTHQVQYIRDKCLNAPPTAFDQKVTGLMPVFVNISSKIGFILKTMPDSLHRLIRTSWTSFPAAFTVPSRNRE